MSALANNGRLLPFLLLLSGFVAVVAMGAPVPKDGTEPYVKWRIQSDKPSNEMHDPIVVNDAVIVGNDRGEVCAYRAKDGALLWRHEEDRCRIYYRPSSEGERVYFTGVGLVAVSADNGKQVWRFGSRVVAGVPPVVRGVPGPVLAIAEKGMVVVASDGGDLCAVEAKTGELRWKADFLTDAPKDPPGFDGNRARLQGTQARPTALASDGQFVFLSVFDQCQVIAFHATTGKRIWSFQAGGWIYGPAAFTTKNVFIGSQDDCFYCLDKQAGKEVWKFKTKGRIESGAVVDSKAVYFGSCDGHCYALNQAGGKELWRFETDKHSDGKPSAIYSQPVLRRGILCFAAGEGQVYGLAADSGKMLWKLRPAEDSELYCSPASDGVRYF